MTNDEEKIEEWRPIPQCPGYEASSYGNIRNSDTNVGLRGSACVHGYRKVSIKYLGKRRTISVHRLVALAFGIIQEPDYVNHIDGVKTNNVISNLEKSNPSHNIKHAWDTGLQKKKFGHENHFSKLSKEQAEDLIRSYAKGEMVVSIARRMSITNALVSRIAFGPCWPEMDELRKELNIKKRSPRPFKTKAYEKEVKG